MANRIIYFRTFIFLNVFSIIGCSTEEIYLKDKRTGNKNGIFSKHLTGIEARKVADILKKELRDNGNSDLISTKANSTQMRLNEFEIDYNDILLVLDTLGVKNYTFKVINHPDDSEAIFHNLVLNEDEYNNRKLLMLKYEKVNQSLPFNQFQGTISKKGISNETNPCDNGTYYANFDTGLIVPGNGGAVGTLPPSVGSIPPNNSGSGGDDSGSVPHLTLHFLCNSCTFSASSWAAFSTHRDEKGNVWAFTIIVGRSSSAPTTLTDPCNPDGSIGVVEPVEDCNTSKEDLMLAFPNLSDENAEILANTINLYGNDFGIDTNFKLNHFLSQIAHETGGLSNLNRTEIMNYTNGNRLVEVFPTRFSYTNPNKANPDEYIGNAEKIGNYVYCCRMGNGSVLSEEGYKYRGRGLIQLTGKTNYQNFQNYYNQKYPNDTIDIINNPETVSDSVEIAVLSAMWYFKTSVINKTLLIDNLNEPVREVTEKVNGGLNGLTDRINKYNNCESFIDCITN